ncbi:MAG: hypothetical protein QOC77_1747, partial [Thermoleophilaceae bacterium]|nr:hypothetical protein [Thermoleophilaceae bacterium]
MPRRVALLAALLVGAALFSAAPAQASQLQNVSAVTLSTHAGGAQHVRYSFSITTSASGALGSGGTIRIDADNGTVLPTVATLHNDTTNTTISRSATTTNVGATTTIHLCCTDTINPGDTVTITLDDVTNPGAALHSLSASTSADVTPVASPSFTLNAAGTVSGVTAPTVSSTAGNAQHVRYSFSFTTSSPDGGLVGPGTIVITAPTGTVLPGVASLHDNNTGATISRSGTLTNSSTTLTVHLCCTDAINAGDTVVVTLDDVKNAAANPSPYTLSVSTSSDPAPVASQNYTLDNPNPVT